MFSLLLYGMEILFPFPIAYIERKQKKKKNIEFHQNLWAVVCKYFVFSFASYRRVFFKQHLFQK